MLLDFGGTLDSPGVHWSTQFARAFADCGFAVLRSDLDRAFFRSERELESMEGVGTLKMRPYVQRQTELMFQALGLAGDGLGKVVAAFVERSSAHLAAARTLLQHYRRHFRFGIVSNFSTNLPVILREFELAPLMDVTVVSQLVGLKKPANAIFELALRRLGSDRTEAAMVGDSLRNDVMGARGAGLEAVWLRGDETFGGGDESSAAFVARDLRESLDHLLERRSHAGRDHRGR